MSNINDNPGGVFNVSLNHGVEEVLGRSSYASLDCYFHFRMAKSNYEKAIQLHTSGVEYKKIINNMIYLEDDYNDNAYHFGAAMDRYMMINGVFVQKIRECIVEAEDDAIINIDNYYQRSS